MLQILLNLFIAVGVLILTSLLVPGLKIDSFGVALVACVVLAILNHTLRPLMSFIALPLTVITLGLFSFVINALVLALAAWLVDGLTVDSATAAILGAVVLSVLQLIMSTITPGKKKLLG